LDDEELDRLLAAALTDQGRAVLAALAEVMVASDGAGDGCAALDIGASTREPSATG
jgi:hypothetical protein